MSHHTFAGITRSYLGNQIHKILPNEYREMMCVSDRREYLVSQLKKYNKPVSWLASQLSCSTETVQGWLYNKSRIRDIPMLRVMRVFENTPLIEPVENFTERFHTLLVDKGVENKWVAKQVGVHPGTIRCWKKGVYEPNNEMQVRVIKLLEQIQ